MKKVFLFLAVLVMAIFTACNNNEQVLTSKIDSLEQELLIYQTDPQKLVSNIDTLYKNQDTNSLLAIKDTLLRYHPESKEYEIVSKLYDNLLVQIHTQKENERKECLSALNSLRKEKDDVYGLTFYRNRYFTHYVNSNHVSLYAIYNDTTKDVNLRLKISYNGDNWIFFDYVYLSYDGKTQEIHFDEYRDKETDNEGGYVWEWINVDAKQYITFLDEMANAKKVKVRFSGKYSQTRYLTNNEIKGIREVLNGYKALKLYSNSFEK